MSDLAAPLRAESPDPNQSLIVMLPPASGPCATTVASPGSFPLRMPFLSKSTPVQTLPIQPRLESPGPSVPNTTMATTPSVFPAFQVVGGVVRVLIPPNKRTIAPAVQKKKVAPPPQKQNPAQECTGNLQKEIRPKKPLTVEEIMQQYKAIVPRKKTKQRPADLTFATDPLFFVPVPCGASPDSTNTASTGSSGICYPASTSTDTSTRSSMQPDQGSTAITTCSTLTNMLATNLTVPVTQTTVNGCLSATASEVINMTSNTTSSKITLPAVDTAASAELNCESLCLSEVSRSQIVVLGASGKAASSVANSGGQNSNCDLVMNISSVETDSVSRSVNVQLESLSEEGVISTSNAINGLDVESDSDEITNFIAQTTDNESNVCKSPEDLGTEIFEEEPRQFRRMTRSMVRKSTHISPSDEKISTPLPNCLVSNVTGNTILNATKSNPSLVLNSEDCSTSVSKIDNTITPRLLSSSCLTPSTGFVLKNIAPNSASSTIEPKMEIVINNSTVTSNSVKSMENSVQFNKVVAKCMITPIDSIPKMTARTDPNLRNCGFHDTSNSSKGLDVHGVNLHQDGSSTVVPKVIEKTLVPSSNGTPNLLGDSCSTGITSITTQAPLVIHSNNISGPTNFSIPLAATKAVRSTVQGTLIPISLNVVVNKSTSSVGNSFTNTVNSTTFSLSNNIDLSCGANTLVSPSNLTHNVMMSATSSTVVSSSNFRQEVAFPSGANGRVSPSNHKVMIANTQSAVVSSSKFPPKVVVTSAANRMVPPSTRPPTVMNTNPTSAQVSPSNFPQQVAIAGGARMISHSSFSHCVMIPKGANTTVSPSNFPHQVMMTNTPNSVVSPTIHIQQVPGTHGISSQVSSTNVPHQVMVPNATNTIVPPSNVPHTFMIANTPAKVVSSSIFPQQVAITGGANRMISPSNLPHQVMIMNTPNTAVSPSIFPQVGVTGGTNRMISPSNLPHQVMIMNTSSTVVSPSIIPQHVAVPGGANRMVSPSNFIQQVSVTNSKVSLPNFPHQVKTPNGVNTIISHSGLPHQGMISNVATTAPPPSNFQHDTVLPNDKVSSSISNTTTSPSDLNIGSLNTIDTPLKISQVGQQDTNVSSRVTNLDFPPLSEIKIKTEPEELNCENDFILPDSDELGSPIQFDRVDVKCEDYTFENDTPASDPLQMCDPLAVDSRESSIPLLCSANENCVKEEEQFVELRSVDTLGNAAREDVQDDDVVVKKEISADCNLEGFMSENGLKTERKDVEEDSVAKAIKEEELSEPVFHLAGDTLIKIQVPKNSLDFLSQSNEKLCPAVNQDIVSDVLYTTKSSSLIEDRDVRCQCSIENISQSHFGRTIEHTHLNRNELRFTQSKYSESSDEEIDVEGIDDIDDIDDIANKSDGTVNTSYSITKKSHFGSSVDSIGDVASQTSQRTVVNNVIERVGSEVGSNFGSLVSIDCDGIRNFVSNVTSGVSDGNRSCKVCSAGVTDSVGNTAVRLNEHSENSLDSLSCDSNVSTKNINKGYVEDMCANGNVMIERTSDKEAYVANLRQKLKDQMMEDYAPTEYCERNEKVDVDSITDNLTTHSRERIKNNVEKSDKKRVSPKSPAKEINIQNCNTEKVLLKSLTNCSVVLRNITPFINCTQSSQQGNVLRRSLRNRKIVNYKEDCIPRVIYSSEERLRRNALNRTCKNLNKESTNSSAQECNLHHDNMEGNNSNSSSISLCNLKQKLQSKISNTTSCKENNLCKNDFSNQMTNISEGTCQKSFNEKILRNKLANDNIHSTSETKTGCARLNGSNVCDVALEVSKNKHYKSKFNIESSHDVEEMMTAEDVSSDDSISLQIDETIECNDAGQLNSRTRNDSTNDTFHGLRMEISRPSEDVGEMSGSDSARPLFTCVEETPVGILRSIETVSNDPSIKVLKNNSQENSLDASQLTAVHSEEVQPIQLSTCENERNSFRGTADTLMNTEDMKNSRNNRTSVLRESLIEMINKDFECVEIPSWKRVTKIEENKKGTRRIGVRKKSKKKSSKSPDKTDFKTSNADLDLRSRNNIFFVHDDVPELQCKIVDLSENQECLGNSVADESLARSSSALETILPKDHLAVDSTKSLVLEGIEKVECCDEVFKSDLIEETFQLHSIKEINDSYSEPDDNSPVSPNDLVNSLGETPAGENYLCETFENDCEKSSAHELNVTGNSNVINADPKCVMLTPVVESSETSVGMLPSIEGDNAVGETYSESSRDSNKSDTPEVCVISEGLAGNESSSVSCYDNRNVLSNMVSTNTIESLVLDNDLVKVTPPAKITTAAKATTDVPSGSNSGMFSEGCTNSSDEVIVVDSNSSDRRNEISFSRRPRIKRLRKNQTSALTSDVMQSTVSCKWTDYDTAICNISPVSNKITAVSTPSVTKTTCEVLCKDGTVPRVIRNPENSSTNCEHPVYTIDSEDSFGDESDNNSNSVELSNQANQLSGDKNMCEYNSSSSLVHGFTTESDAVNRSATAYNMPKNNFNSSIYDKANAKSSSSGRVSHVGDLGREQFECVEIVPSRQASGVFTPPLKRSKNNNLNYSSAVVLPSRNNSSGVSMENNSFLHSCDTVCTNSLVNGTATVTISKTTGTANILTTTTNTITTTCSELPHAAENSVNCSKERMLSFHQGCTNLSTSGTRSLLKSAHRTSESFVQGSNDESPVEPSTSSNRPDEPLIVSVTGNLQPVNKNISLRIASVPIPVVDSNESLVVERSGVTNCSKGSSAISKYRKIMPRSYKNFGAYVRVAEDMKSGYIRIPVNPSTVERMDTKTLMKLPEFRTTLETALGNILSQVEVLNGRSSVDAKQTDPGDVICNQNSTVEEVTTVSDTVADCQNETLKSNSSRVSLHQGELANPEATLVDPLSQISSRLHQSASSLKHLTKYQRELILCQELFNNRVQVSQRLHQSPSLLVNHRGPAPSREDTSKDWPVSRGIRVWLNRGPTGPRCKCPLGERCTCGAKELFDRNWEKRQSWEEREEQRKRLRMQKKRLQNRQKQLLCEQCGELTHRRNLYKHRHKHEYYKEKPSPAHNECKLCSKTFKYRAHYVTHMKTTHKATADQIYECCICGENLSTAKALYVHSNCHSTYETFRREVLSCMNKDKQQRVSDGGAEGSEVSCNERELEGRGKRKLEEEEDVTIVGEVYVCSRCRMCFPSSKQLREHESLFREGAFYPCNICCSTFHRVKELDLHRTEHERRNDCQGSLTKRGEEEYLRRKVDAGGLGNKEKG